MRAKAYAFVSALALLLENGCTLRESLEALRGNETGGFFSVVAAKALASLGNGEPFSAAIAESGLGANPDWISTLAILERTGAILGALSLLKEEMERKEKARSKISGALAYPLAVIAAALAGGIALLVRGIPWLVASGFTGTGSAASGMRSGVICSIAFLVACAAALTIGGTRALSRRETRCRFWLTLGALTDSGIPLDTAVDLCSGLSGEKPIAGDFSPAVRDFFQEAILASARVSGEYATAIARIAVREKVGLECLYDSAARLAEPAGIAVAGIVFAILAATVMLPILTIQGGIL